MDLPVRIPWRWVVVVALLLSWGYFIWPAPWAYYTASRTNLGGRVDDTLMRRNRFTGEVESMDSGKWRPDR